MQRGTGKEEAEEWEWEWVEGGGGMEGVWDSGGGEQREGEGGRRRERWVQGKVTWETEGGSGRRAAEGEAARQTGSPDTSSMGGRQHWLEKKMRRGRNGQGVRRRFMCAPYASRICARIRASWFEP